MADIDGEVVRLNRIVNDVLDFARPIRFELAATDINALCRDAAAAAQVTPGPPVALTLDRVGARDHDRRRAAAPRAGQSDRQRAAGGRCTRRPVARPRPAARAAAASRRTTGRAVVVTTRPPTRGSTITIADTGRGIDPEDLPRIFDPYFTTKRGGTGLGLPIAKNIVEGLGGTLTVRERARAAALELRIELPVPVRQADRRA